MFTKIPDIALNINLEQYSILLSNDVIFSPLQRTLSCDQSIVRLSEKESILLKILLTKTSTKKEIVYEIWEKQGAIVTDSSYYKLVRQLRNSFKKVDLDEELILTLPRVGVLYTGTKKIISPQTVTPERKTTKEKNYSMFISTMIILIFSLILYSIITR